MYYINIIHIYIYIYIIHKYIILYYIYKNIIYTMQYQTNEVQTYYLATLSFMLLHNLQAIQMLSYKPQV